MLHIHIGKLTKTARFLRCSLAVIIAIVLVLPGGLLGPIPVMAEGVTYNWTGDTKDGYWRTPGNWKVGEETATVEPGNGDTVIIPELSVVEVESVYNTSKVILQCEGNLTVSGGTLNTRGDSTISGRLVNNGKVTVTGSGWDTLTLSGGGEGSGDFDIGGGKKLKFTGGTFTVDGNINDLGTGASVDVSAPATPTEVTINGSYNILGSTMVGMGAKVEWKGTVNSVGKLTNYGEANFYSDVTIKPLNLVGGTVYSHGVNITLDGAGHSFTEGTIGGTGYVTIDSGAALEISSASSKNLWQNLKNKGTVTFKENPPDFGSYSFENRGIVSINSDCTSNLDIVNYSQTEDGKLKFEIDFGQPGGKYAKLNTDAPVFGGELHVNPKSAEKSPNVGDSFDLVTYNTKPTSKFSGVTSGVAGISFQEIYYGDKLTVVATPEGKVMKPAATPAAGDYNTPQSVTLSTVTPDATIYYTTDGSNPTTAGTKYTEPIAVSEETTIKAIAVKTSLENSDISEFCYDIYFSGGEGTEGNPYKIATAEQLYKAGYLPDAHFEQTADINLGVAPYNVDEGWWPIGDSISPFTGVYNGKGFTISNLRINPVADESDPAREDIGLFGYICGATIENVKLEDVDVAGDKYVGGLAGYADDNSKIINCSVTGEVTGTGDYVGGLVGGNNNGEIKGSHAECKVTGQTQVGGLAGCIGDGTILRAYATGAVTGNDSVGGLAGWVDDNGSVVESYSTGSVLGTTNAGGLVGKKSENNTTVSNSYWDTEASGQPTSDGGEGKVTAEMRNQGTYEGWDFIGTWDIGSGKNDGYPFFRELPDTQPPVWLTCAANEPGTPGVTILVKIDENGTAYYLVLTRGAGTPTSEQVKNGQNGQGEAVAAGMKGSSILTANIEKSIAIVGLAPGTAYDIYAAAEDTAGNLQGEPRKLDVNTQAAELTPNEAIILDLADITWNTIKGSNSTENNVTGKLNTLPTVGAHGTTVSWSVSPDGGWINTTTGAVIRPSAGQSNVQVTLTATVSKEGGDSGTKSFFLTIPALSGGDSSKDKDPGKGGSDRSSADGGSTDGSSTDGSGTINGQENQNQGSGWDNPFTDVSETDWYYEAAMKTFKNGLINGTASNAFSPGLNATRAMIVAILYRLDGEPSITGAAIFSDVPAGAWYANAVTWAAENNIITGYGSGEFGTEDSITREQVTALLYRYSGYRSHNSRATGDISAFTDSGQVSEWAETAMQWAVGAGIIQGKPGNVLDPKGTATRAEIAVMLSRFIQKYNLLQP